MPRGTTSYEVEKITGMLHQTVSARRTDLRAAGYTEYLLDENGEPVRRATPTGSSAIVEVVTQKGKDALKSGLPLRLNSGDPTRGRHRGNPTSTEAFKSTDKHGDARYILEVMNRYS